jgi:DNA replication protein DnaC
MNLVELDRALRQLRLGGMATVLESRLLQAQSEHMAPIDLVSVLVSDELRRRADRLLERRTKHAHFRDTDKSLDNFDFDFNKKMNRRMIYELAAGHFVTKHEDALFLGPPGTGKSHLAQAIGRAAIQQGHRVMYREAHALVEQLADATIDGTRKETMDDLASVPLLIIDDLGMRKLPPTAAEDLLELSCAATSEPARSSPPTGPWKTGARSWETPPPSLRCWTACSTTGTSSSAALEAGEHGSARTCRPRRTRGRCYPSPGAQLAGFDPSTTGRI